MTGLGRSVAFGTGEDDGVSADAPGDADVDAPEDADAGDTDAAGGTADPPARAPFADVPPPPDPEENNGL